MTDSSSPSSPSSLFGPPRPLVEAIHLDIPRNNPQYKSYIRGSFVKPQNFDDILARVGRTGHHKSLTRVDGFRPASTGEKEAIAVKVFTRRDEEVFTRLGELTRIWRAFDHSRILKFYGHCTLPSHILLVSPWMDRGSLRDYLLDDGEVDRHELVVQVGDGLTYLHETMDIVHGNVAAENILVDKDGNVKITDAGLGKLMWETRRESNDAWRHYAPELLLCESASISGATGLAPAPMHRPPMTKESDVYAYGLLVLEVFTDKASWSGLAKAEVMEKARCKEQPQMSIEDQTTATAHGFNAVCWIVCQSCWEHEPCNRLRMRAAYDLLQLFKDVDGLQLSFSIGVGDIEHSPSSAPAGSGWSARRKSSAARSLVTIGKAAMNRMRKPWSFERGSQTPLTVPELGYGLPRSDSPEASDTGIKPSRMSTSMPKRPRAVTQQLWRKVVEHFEIYEGTSYQGYYAYQYSPEVAQAERANRIG